MSNELEIEFKNLLTETEYHQLMTYFHATDDECWTQENHYYDTPEFALKKKHSALRIRLLPDKAEMTLKTPLHSHLLESTELISREAAFKMVNSEKIIPYGDVSKKLDELGIDEQTLERKMSLTTHRFERNIEQALLVLDKSSYRGNTDFELELEASEPETGEQVFRSLLTQFDIPKRHTPNKIQRAYNAQSQN